MREFDEKNRYQATEQDEEKSSGLKRRDFFRLLGGGILIFIKPWEILDAETLQQQQRRALTGDYNAFLHVAEDGTITCYTGKIEMGQGIITSLPVMMADELNVTLDKIKIVMGDTALCPYDAGTWGSQSTQTFGPAMRAAAAEAKEVLVEMASARLGVPASQLEVRDGVVTDIKNSRNSVSYGQLSKGQKLTKYLDAKPAVEDYSKFTLVGKSYKHSDAYQKVTGQAKYTGDYKLPGMVYARLLRPPKWGAKLKAADVSEAEKIAGVTVVRDGDLIAVLSENQHYANEAVGKIKAEWTFEEITVNNTNIFERMVNTPAAPRVSPNVGDIEAGRKQSDIVVESEFHDVFLAHAPIETHTALARFEGDQLTVWAATQTPFGLQEGLVRELGMPMEKVRVITPFLGGGFGGKSAFQQGIEAAKIAKLSGKPVMVMWTREEEFFFDTFHTAAVVKVNSGIDRQGKIQMWDYHVWYAGTRGAEVIYDVPNARTTSYSRDRNVPAVHPFNTGPWRAPNNNTNTFARETQIDILASMAGIDPLEFRLRNLKDEKMIACLKGVADKFGYIPGKTPSGRGIGVACGHDAGTWVAEMAEVKVDKTTGKVTVVRIACVQDMGLCVNPQGALIQMEGCLTMAMGYTFTEEVLFEGGDIITRGFDNYEIPRFASVPKMDCVILDRKDKPPRGGGEPAIIAVSAVIANAVFDATGARLYRVPLTPARILEALRRV
jgi:nicotinate dehydrogenase subunit B